MNLSKKTIKFLVDYLEGIKSISPGYLDSSEVIKDFEDYIVFMKHKPGEVVYSIKEALEEGLTNLNGSVLLLHYLNSRLDNRYFLANNNTDIQKATSLLGEILEPEGYNVVLNDNNVYTIGQTSKNASKKIIQMLFGL